MNCIKCNTKDKFGALPYCPDCYKDKCGEYPTDYNPGPDDDAPSWLDLMTPMHEVKPSHNSPLFGNYFNRGEVSILASAPKSGKTWICLDIAQKVSQGDAAFGRYRPVNPLNVLYMFGDNQPGFLKDRSDKLNYTPSPYTSNNLRILDQFQFRTNRKKLVDLVDNKDFDILIESCKQGKIDLIFIDTMVAWTGVNEAKNEELRPLLLNLQRLAHDTGAHVCVLHHNRKESGHGGGLDKIIGGTVLVRLVGEIYTIRADIDEESGEILSKGWLIPLGGWYDKPQRCYYDICRVVNDTTTVSYDFDKQIICSDQQSIIDEINLMMGEWTMQDLMIATGAKYATANRAVKKLMKQQQLERRGSGRNTKYFAPTTF